VVAFGGLRRLLHGTAHLAGQPRGGPAFTAKVALFQTAINNGLLRDDTGGMLLRFVQGRPVSQVTEDFLAWVCERLAAEGKKALLLVWDNASWHISQRVRTWIKAHNRQAKHAGGVRIVACRLPSKSPWLNAIEPKWVHGKKAITEPDRLLTAQEVRERVYDYYGCEQVPPLEQKVA